MPHGCGRDDRKPNGSSLSYCGREVNLTILRLPATELNRYNTPHALRLQHPDFGSVSNDVSKFQCIVPAVQRHWFLTSVPADSFRERENIRELYLTRHGNNQHSLAPQYNQTHMCRLQSSWRKQYRPVKLLYLHIYVSTYLRVGKCESEFIESTLFVSCQRQWR